MYCRTGNLEFAQNKDQNKLFPGTTWKYIGENKTIRFAATNGTDVITTGGSDSVTLSVNDLFAHSPDFSANTSISGRTNPVTLPI